MERFGFCAASSLIWRGWGFAVPFYSVQDCSFLKRGCFSLAAWSIFALSQGWGLIHNTRHKSLKQEPFVLNFLQISYIHSWHLRSHLNLPLSFLNVEPRVFWSSEMTVIPKSTLEKGKITQVFQDLWRVLQPSWTHVNAMHKRCVMRDKRHKRFQCIVPAAYFFCLDCVTLLRQEYYNWKLKVHRIWLVSCFLRW